MNDLSKRLKEVDVILSFLSKDDYNKIPKKVIEYIKENEDKYYIFNIDTTKKIYEQKIHKDTIAILSYLNMEYIVNEEQKEFLKKLYEYNDKK